MVSAVTEKHRANAMTAAARLSHSMMTSSKCVSFHYVSMFFAKKKRAQCRRRVGLINNAKGTTVDFGDGKGPVPIFGKEHIAN
jgi:hypothetical protein